MSEVFGARGLMYWWGMLTATLFLKDWLKQLAGFFKSPNTFTPEKIPFSILPGLNSWIDGVGGYLRAGIQFKPNEPLFTMGAIFVPSYAVAFLIGSILIIVAVVLVTNAIRSPKWYDDFIALFVSYVVFRLIGHILSLVTALPFANSFRSFVDNPFAAYLVIMGILLFISFFGEGSRMKRAFWRAIIAGSLLSLFMYPRETAGVLGSILDALAVFGASLANPLNLAFTIVWGLIGMFLALQRLAMPEGGGNGRGGRGGNDGGDTTKARAEVEVGQS